MLQNEVFYEIDRTLFLEYQRLCMDASIQLNLVDLIMVRQLYELEKKEMPLQTFAKMVCKHCRHNGWIHCIMHYLCPNKPKM